MSIRSFSYEDLDSGWRLEESSFDALNLLVGLSGAGKTQILEALKNVRKAALSGAADLPSARWHLEIEVGPETYRWQAETRVTFAEMPAQFRWPDAVAESDSSTDSHFVSEQILRGDQVLVERSTEFRFEDKPLPKLTPEDSAIGLLAIEDSLWPLHEALRSWRTLDMPWSLGSIASISQARMELSRLAGRLDLLQRATTLSPWLKLYVLQQNHPDTFQGIVEDFAEIFETVEELKVATYGEFEFKPNLGADFMANNLAVGLRERGVEGWILHTQFSSGMAKTLAFLIETELAPAGRVFLIDELENGLGVNCLPAVAERMLRGLDQVQYIATSHHPRIINGIPFEAWKIVTRDGSRVRTIPASEFTSLKQASPLEKFTELINLLEFREGVA